MDYQKAWTELKEKLIAVDKELCIEMFHTRSNTESRRLDRRREAMNAVAKWMKEIEAAETQTKPK